MYAEKDCSEESQLLQVWRLLFQKESLVQQAFIYQIGSNDSDCEHLWGRLLLEQKQKGVMLVGYGKKEYHKHWVIGHKMGTKAIRWILRPYW